MLVGLHLRDFALADHVALDLHEGFTVITGETGAGKSILVHALSFALGSPADAESIRPSADAAEVEATFDLHNSQAARSVGDVLEAVDIPFDGELIIRRSVRRSRNGSSRLSGRLRINDRAATVAVLRELSPLLADIHGQHEHLSLLRPQEQLALLDRFGGLAGQRQEVASMSRCLRALDRRLRAFAGDERERARRIALLRHEAAEITAAGLHVDEEDRLERQHRQLVHAQALAADAASAMSALDNDVLGAALAAVRRIAEIDSSASEIADALESAVEQSAEAARALRSYADGVQLDPQRLAEVESRLAFIGDMKRRWGDTVAEVIAYGEEAQAEAERLESEAASGDAMETEAAELASALSVAASELSRLRRDAAARLSEAVARECEHLQLSGARLTFQFNQATLLADERALSIDGEERGFDQSGIDRVELLVAFNRGVSPRPLRRVASGGETARLVLAIKAVLGESDLAPLMVFDEVDVGLGGRSGGMIGERLARLGEQRQVLCITHLPQVAARARQHITVSKAAELSGSAERTSVHVRMLSAQERIEELADMLGGSSIANRTSAADLLQAAVGP